MGIPRGKKKGRHIRLFITAGKVHEFLGVWPTERDARFSYDRAALYFGVDR